jgi:hypothetical protein
LAEAVPSELVVDGASICEWYPYVPWSNFPSCLLKLQRDFESVVVDKKGFKWVNERPDAKSENDEKWVVG